MSTNTVRKTKMGATKPYWAPVTAQSDGVLPTYGVAHKCSEMVALTENLNLAEGSFYSDDAQSEYQSEFKYCDLTYDNKGLTDVLSSAMFGQDYTDGVLSRRAADNPPYGGFSFSRTLIDDGVKYYEGVHYPLLKARLGNDTVNTKNDNITMTGDSMTLRAKKCNTDEWKRTKIFTTAADADLWAQTQIGYSTAYVVEVGVSGTGTVSPTGATMVASGGNAVINISGTPTKVYDNGTDVTASVSSNKYTISNVSADHNIAVVYTA